MPSSRNSRAWDMIPALQVGNTGAPAKSARPQQFYCGAAGGKSDWSGSRERETRNNRTATFYIFR
jgi:hypothetical protein